MVSRVMGYPGSKAQAGVWQRIIGQMPPHSVYVEPFFGSGQVFWHKRRAASTIVMDLDPGCIAEAGAEAGVSAICGDAISGLQVLGKVLPADSVIYCDPPYLLSTRNGRRYYKHEMTDDHHTSLLAMLQELRCQVLLSGYPSELYDKWLKGWRCLSYTVRTRGRSLTECLWCNFAEPTELHDWRYAGQTFRQRLHFNRVAARWLARLEGMPPRQRGFLLESIAQRHGQRCRPLTPNVALRSATPEMALAAGNAEVGAERRHLLPRPALRDRPMADMAMRPEMDPVAPGMTRGYQ